MEAPGLEGECPEAMEGLSDPGLWARPPGLLSRLDVHRMAGLLGASLRALHEAHGPDSVVALVPQVVRVLELLEAFAERGDEQSRGREALRALKSLRTGEERGEELEQKVFEAQRKEHLLQNEVSRLMEENQKLLVQLTGNQSQDDNAAKEHELMLKLKEVVDRQRDEIRAQSHEIQQKSSDTEALQEQLDRFMRMNEDLRRKLSVVQTQLKTTLERKMELETLMQAPQDEMHRRPRSRAMVESSSPEKKSSATALNKEEPAVQDGATDSNQPCFTKKEVQQILQERNELKTNLFLIQEELSYYQRQWQIHLNGWITITLMCDDRPGPICPLAVPATRSNLSSFTVV
ncbi:rab-interacting lysosomal protein isoform X2 [Ambystoma mexicanum]|uniref:rab-interacting lysosomal protein isoform X2 n=1 Tax=Ambystoma mexicanum TaxID=8296 RepID=UPI0037E9AC86